MSSRLTAGLADHLVVGVDGAHVGEVEQRVEQHRGVPGREHEAVAVGPDRVGGVEAQEALPERVGDRRQRHRRPGMARVGLLDRVDRQRADRVDAELVDVLGHDLESILLIPAHGSMRVTAPSPLSATQTASPATATAPGWRPTGDRVADRFAAFDVDAADACRRAALATQTTLVPASIPPGRPPTAIGSPSSARVAGSTRVTLSERLLATQTMPPPTVTPEGPRPTTTGGAGDGAAEVDAAHRAGRRRCSPRRRRRRPRGAAARRAGRSRA